MVDLGWGLLFGPLWLISMFIGPIAGLYAYVAMVDRLRRENPDNPLVQGNWNTLLGDARSTDILKTYFNTYGLDENVALEIAGMVVMILWFYFSTGR